MVVQSFGKVAHRSVDCFVLQVLETGLRALLRDHVPLILEPAYMTPWPGLILVQGAQPCAASGDDGRSSR